MDLYNILSRLPNLGRSIELLGKEDKCIEVIYYYYRKVGM